MWIEGLALALVGAASMAAKRDYMRGDTAPDGLSQWLCACVQRPVQRALGLSAMTDAPWSRSDVINDTRRMVLMISLPLVAIQFVEGAAHAWVSFGMLAVLSGMVIGLYAPGLLRYEVAFHVGVFVHCIVLTAAGPMPSFLVRRFLMFRALTNFMCVAPLDLQVLYFAALCCVAACSLPAVEVAKAFGAFCVLASTVVVVATRGRSAVLWPRMRRRLSFALAVVSLVLALVGTGMSPVHPPEERVQARYKASALFAVVIVALQGYHVVREGGSLLDWARKLARCAAVALATWALLIGLVRYGVAPAAVRETVALSVLPVHASLVTKVWPLSGQQFVTDSLVLTAVNLAFASAERLSTPGFVHLQMLAIVLVLHFSVHAARHETAQLIEREQASDHFVFSRLKQKLVGSGHAIQQAMVGSGSAHHNVLAEALAECRYAADLCQLLAVTRKLRNGSYTGAVRCLDVAQAAEEWRSRAYDVRYPRDSAPMELDWDLVWLLVVRHVGRGGWVQLDAVSGAAAGDDAGAALRMSVQPAAPPLLKQQRDVLSTQALLLSRLHGKVAGPLTFVVPARSCAVPRPWLPSVPEGVLVAVLDDNVLSRAVIWRFCEAILKCAPDSVAMGATAGEARGFASHLARAQPALAIVDCYLEFDNEPMQSGLAVAREARALGFRGCLVMYSANDEAHTTSSAKDAAAVDGFVPKTLSMAKMKEGFGRAWRKRYG